MRLRKELADVGLDAGAVIPQPAKRPRSSYIRFVAEQPNQTWQSDVTHYRLTNPDGTPGRDVEIISWLDDHSRYALAVTAHLRITGPIVLASFRETVALHGIPASTLTDNGMVFTTRFAGGRGGRTSLENELRRLHVTQKNSRPNTHNLRQSRTVPADDEEVAACPARPTDHDR